MQVLRAVLAMAAVGVLLAGAWPQPAGAVLEARDAGLAYLAALPPGTLAPYVLEAAVAAGKDPSAWPPGHPALSAVHLPGNGTAYLAFLRPAYALSRVPGVPQRDAIYNGVVHGWDGRQFGDPALLDDDTFALLTLAAVVPDWGLEPWHSMPDSLLANQSAAGGWSWAVNGTPDTDSTGIAVAALAASRPGQPLPADVGAFLATVHNADGGFGGLPGQVSNCDSTVWGMRAAALAGADDRGALGFLLSLRRGDGGFAYLPSEAGSNALCTAEATILLADLAAGRLPGHIV